LKAPENAWASEHHTKCSWHRYKHSKTLLHFRAESAVSITIFAAYIRRNNDCALQGLVVFFIFTATLKQACMPRIGQSHRQRMNGVWEVR
jgi:hypothetical protein